MKNSDIEVCQTNEISRLRAVLAEQRALIRKLLSDRDEHVAAITNGYNAYKNLERCVEKLETVIAPLDEGDVPAVKGFMKSLQDKIAAVTPPGNGK